MRKTKFRKSMNASNRSDKIKWLLLGILWVYKLDVEDDKFIILFCQEIRISILISTKQKTNI